MAFPPPEIVYFCLDQPTGCSWFSPMSIRRLWAIRPSVFSKADRERLLTWLCKPYHILGPNRLEKKIIEMVWYKIKSDHARLKVFDSFLNKWKKKLIIFLHSYPEMMHSPWNLNKNAIKLIPYDWLCVWSVGNYNEEIPPSSLPSSHPNKQIPEAMT